MDVNNCDTNIIHDFRRKHPIISAPVDVIKQPVLLIKQTVKIGFFLGYTVVAVATTIAGLCLGAIYGAGKVLDNFFGYDVDNKFNFKPAYDYAITFSKAFSENSLVLKLLLGAAGAGAATVLASPVFVSPYFWGTLACAAPLSIIDTAVNGQPQYTRQLFDGVWKYSDPYTYFNTPAEEHEELEAVQEKLPSFTHNPDKGYNTKKSVYFKPKIIELKQASAAEPKISTLYCTPETPSTQQDFTDNTGEPGQRSDTTQSLPQKRPPAHNSTQTGSIPPRIQLPRHQPASDVNRFCTLTQLSSPKDAVVLNTGTGHEEIFSYHELAKMSRRFARKEVPLVSPNTRLPFDWNQVFRVPAKTIRQWVKEEARGRSIS
ncbi:hypothetical protein [Endozoicomonas sp.]|uniref:hypothetical protein n=1 Tax=Endozoicomonas sp. TaxID=1892382 RepID=UPI00383B344B